MKIRYGVWILLILSLLLFVSCTGDGGDPTATTGEAESERSESSLYLQLTSNRETEYQIVNGTTLLNDSHAVRKFAADLSEKTGAAFRVVKPSDPETEHEIIIGHVPGRAVSDALYSELSYTEYGVKLENGKIALGFYTSVGLERVLAGLDEVIVKESKELNNWGLVKEYKQRGNQSNVTVPLFENAGALQGIYPCGERNYEASFEGTELSEYEAYTKKLESDGYTVYDTHEMNDNRFATYIKGTVQINLSFYPAKGLTKIVYGSKGYLPATEQGTVEALVTPSLAMMGINEADDGAAPGMSFAVQLSDGRYIIVDGGTDHPINRAALLQYLKENNPNAGKPVIAMWLITHAHGDHLSLANAFIEEYHGEVELECVAYNFPDFDSIQMSHEDPVPMKQLASKFKTLVKEHFPASKKLILHTGQHFWVGDAELEVLYTHEDYYPNQYHYGNDTSLAFRMTLGGEKTIFLGDCDPILNQFMADVYKETLKCNNLQLAHHGFNGAVLDIYKYADPEVCFWPTDEERFKEDPRCLGTQAGYEFNAWLRNEEEKVRTHYHASVTTKISFGTAAE